MLGSDSEHLAKDKKPTMVLCFKDMDDIQIKATIIHQFGHALGLGHVPMKSGDWDVVKNFADVQKMMRSYGLQSVQDFEMQWMGKGKKDVNDDPESVMQYWLV